MYRARYYYTKPTS